MTCVAKCIDRSKLAVLKLKMTPAFFLTLASCELGSETPAGWSMHIGGTQMASVLNMDEGSDTTTQTDSVEGKENEGKTRRGGERRREVEGQINKVEPQVAIIYQ